MRIILFTGKGGVGKTTAAAATAIRCAELGYRTLVISTDPAHSLADALDMPLGPEPVAIRENLWGQEFDVYYSMKKYWNSLRQLMLTIFKWRGVKNVVAEELSVLPGMEEASAFLWIEKYYSEGNYDIIIIDSAPTGETLTLLSLPQVTQSWLSKAFPGQKLAIKSIGSVIRKTTGVPVDKGYEEMERLFGKLERIQKIFLDPEITTMRIVANPERMVVQEAKRAYTYLQLYGYHVDAVVLNRVIPESAFSDKDSFFRKYLEAQKTHIQDIEESFAEMPVCRAPHLGEEVFGIPLLEKIGQELYGDRDPSEVFYLENPYEVSETKNGYEVSIKLAFVPEKKYSVEKFGDELVINLANRRKSLFLPRFAQVMEMDSYSFKKPFLKVSLKK